MALRIYWRSISSDFPSNSYDPFNQNVIPQKDHSKQNTLNIKWVEWFFLTSTSHHFGFSQYVWFFSARTYFSLTVIFEVLCRRPVLLSRFWPTFKKIESFLGTQLMLFDSDLWPTLSRFLDFKRIGSSRGFLHILFSSALKSQFFEFNSIAIKACTIPI